MEALSFRGEPRQLRHASRVVEHSVNRASQMIVEPLDEGSPVAMPLAAGSFSMHHGLCPHRSGPNSADHRRIGLGLNYIPTHVRPAGSVKPAAMLVRGTDRYWPFRARRGGEGRAGPGRCGRPRQGRRSLPGLLS